MGNDKRSSLAVYGLYIIQTSAKCVDDSRRMIRNRRFSAGSEVLPEVTMKCTVSLIVKPCSSEKVRLSDEYIVSILRAKD
jgi:hypothetical protein